MTPVEERIDYGHAREIAGDWAVDKDAVAITLSDCKALARAYLDLLTEHSALVKAAQELRRCAAMTRNETLASQEEWEAAIRTFNSTLAALPATESAQPEEDTNG